MTGESKNTIKIFDEKQVRTVWDEEAEKWWFSILDIIGILTDQPDYTKVRNYWKWLKNKLKSEGSELVSDTNQLKMPAADGKHYRTDVADTEQILRLIQFIPSPKTESFKMWLARVGNECTDETVAPEQSIDRVIQNHVPYLNIRKATENTMAVIVNGKPCTLNIFFNADTAKIYFDFFSETNDYRLSFSKIVYHLYSKTENGSDSENLSEGDFVNATNEELIIILGTLVDGNGVRNEYDEIQEGNAFERFYFAHKNPLRGIANAIKTFTTIQQATFSEIQGFVIDFARRMAQYEEQLRAISANLQAPLEAFARALSRLDFSKLSYDKKWKEKHDMLVKFGWFYSNELPDNLIEKIVEKTADIKQDEVDQMIVAHFRKDRCAELKRIVRTWETSQCFLSRKHIFNEVLHCHSQRIYNASVTMLALHIEGVVTDFVRIVLDSQCKAKKALEDINDFIEGMPFSTLTFSDWVLFPFVIEEVLAALTENFEPSNPETTSNNSRHKIAHGHVVEKETEANSLRRFLYLNELYRIFSVIGKELEMESLQGSNPAA